MTYSLALKTNRKEQSVEILEFINKNIPEFKDVFPDYIENVDWSANNLPYIEDYPHIGFNYSGMDDFFRLYTYSILYAIALKFNLQTIINDNPVVIIDYDSQYSFYLSDNNPFAKEDPRFSYFISIENNLVYQRKDKFFKNLFKQFYHLKPNKKEIENMTNIVNKILLS